ncbi:MAG TPA: peptide transporter [Planctomycetota bacterium]|nr:peptide transporter [Planctomycetota bacterium]
MRRLDKDLETYRSLLDTPTEFRDGFGWTTVAGIFFCGLVMLPGSIYLGLMTGGSLGSAASWVTLILFAQIARRAMKTVKRQELVVLLHAATIMIAANAMFPGGPFGHFVYRAFLVTSEAARDAGMTGSFPTWFVPRPDSDAILNRNFFHSDWMVPIGIATFVIVLGLISRYTLGYFFFRVTSDIEKLPFPMAPIAAQGVMALEEMDEKPGVERKSSKWRLFSLGAVIGISFGAVQVGVPAITSLVLGKPVYLIPQPFLDTTTWTEAILPATPTGMTLDIGIIMIGLVLPFWAIVGTFIAISLTLVLNPLLHHFGVLAHWQPGMNTVNTAFSNNVDFWLSFGIGAGLGIAAVSIYSTGRDVIRMVREGKTRKKKAGQAAAGKKGRGDYPLWIALCAYGVAAIGIVTLCHHVVPQIPLVFLCIFSFVYNPFISYVNARLLGIAGQGVDIPFVKESSFILSGAKGVDIWLAPIPIENYGGMAQAFRVNELTGVNFWSLIKAELVAIPVLFLLSGLFWAFIWRSTPIPSEAYPYAQVNWEYASKNNVLLYSSTFVAPGEDPASKSLADSEFMKAIHPKVMGAGVGVTIVGFVIVSALGLPVMLIYGFIRGLGGFPHFMALEIVGALLGRYYFQKRFGRTEFLRMAPTVLAGYFTGVGLTSMAVIAMNLIKNAVSGAPF